MGRALFFLALCAVLLSCLWQLRAQQETPSSSSAAECSTCHEPIFQKARLSPHAQSIAAKWKSEPDSRACLSCHRDAEKHAQTGDPADVAHPFREMPVKQASEVCLSCHDNQRNTVFWDASVHDKEDLSCLSCHNVHQSTEVRLLRGRNELETCAPCHANLRLALFQRSRHPIREGKIECSSCHNPHGAPTERLVSAQSINDKCYECHTELRGPFLWEHSPVRENCLTCHQPHGSTHVRLLRTRLESLCQSCHMQGRHQTVAGPPNSVFVMNKACANCHSQVHGSNHPSGINLQR
ncbi:MAG: DmsE family decaheme c-type cytochrome [Acidobacteria bacterium]|nr:MAG: DmsE family decaheme c-type cytochrome [Acidobacteriota bacterium]